MLNAVIARDASPECRRPDDEPRYKNIVPMRGSQPFCVRNIAPPRKDHWANVLPPAFWIVEVITTSFDKALDLNAPIEVS
ncbi:MAG: hypothetical protein AAFX90_04840 [Pseudomonadota bacterium]